MPQTFFYPDVPYVDFVDPTQLPWREAIQEETATILAETARLGRNYTPYVKSAKDRPQGDVHGMLENASWSTIELTVQGQPHPELANRCSRTVNILSEHAPLCDIPGRAPSIMISRLAAHARIPPHTGMINTRLVCHLPLVVPGAGGIRVGKSTKQWRVGELLAFDDTVEHEAWNDAETDRIVLIFDVWRPEIQEDERAQIRALFQAVDDY